VFGTTYGGDGTTTFALPDLRAACPSARASPRGAARIASSACGGAATHTLSTAELAQHNHAALGSAADATLKSGVAGVPASTASPSYRAPGNLVPMYSGALQPFGGGQSHPNQQPFLAVRFIIALQAYSRRKVKECVAMDPFIGEIRLCGFNFAPQGWAPCDGRLLTISQNTALFSLLGTTFGGNGRATSAAGPARTRADPRDERVSPGASEARSP